MTPESKIPFTDRGAWRLERDELLEAHRLATTTPAYSRLYTQIASTRTQCAKVMPEDGQPIILLVPNGEQESPTRREADWVQLQIGYKEENPNDTDLWVCAYGSNPSTETMEMPKGPLLPQGNTPKSPVQNTQEARRPSMWKRFFGRK